MTTPSRRFSRPASPLMLILLILAGLGIVFGLAAALLSGGRALTPPPPSEVPSLPTQAVETPTPTPTPTPEPTPTPYDYAQPAPLSDEVGDDWFQDAVFIGDSRTDGLEMYGGIAQGNFISYKGLTAFEFDNKKCISSDAGKITALEALSQKKYAKVFLMLGLNELGYATAEFSKGYETMLDQILAAQPDAVLYIQPVVPINPQKALEKKAAYYITNEKIAEFNAEIIRLAEEKQAVFLNVTEGLVDETGVLPYDRTGDGVHFSKDWYKQWYAYIKTHTVDPERLEETP